MNEEYLKGLYEHFGGQAKLGGTFDEWSSSISSNDDYKKGMFETLGGADKMGGSYDEWNTNIFGVKKKVGEEVSASSEGDTTADEKFEQWELDLFKHFDENPKSLSTASSVDLRKYNDYKKSIGEDMNISSTPNQEFLSEQGVADRAEEERSAREDYPLSFQEEERKPVNYFSLFDKKDLVDQANKQGVSVSFVEEASQAAANAEYPIAFLAKRKNIRDRIKKLPEYAPNATTEVQALSNVDIDSRNIDDVESRLQQIENTYLDPMGTVVSTEGRPMEINPTRSAYEREVKENPTGVAIEQLQRDNERLKRAASQEKAEGKGIVGGTVAASEGIAKGAASGIGQYVADYANLVDQLVGNKAITELQSKLDRIERGENIELTTDDKLLMRAIMDNAKLHNELDGEIPTSYKIGESLGQSIGFMGEFVLTGGGLQAAGRGVLKGAAKTGAKKAVGKFGVGTAVKLAQAGIQTAKMPAFYKNTALNVSNGQNFGEAALNAYWETGVESLSERIFMSSPVSGVVGDGATGLLRRAGINFNVDKGAVGVFKNVLEEAAEEKIGEIMTAPKDYETFSEFWKAFTDREQNTIMLGSVALMTGGMGSVALIGNKFSETQRKARVKRIEKYVPSDLRAEIDVITSNVDLSLDQQYALIGDAISSRIDSQELGEDPATTTANAMQYAQYRVQEQAANTTDENAVVENGEITVGDVEPVGNMQDQLDYLNERGVDANGLNAEQVEKLYDKTKSEEDKEAIDEATGGTKEEATEGVKPTPERVILKEETKDDEKEVQEQQVQEQDEERQTEKPTEEVEVSKTGDEARQEDVVQAVEQFTPSDQLAKAKEKIKTKLKGKKLEKYFREVDRLFNPNKTNIVEYRTNGVVTRAEDGKYLFHALADTDLSKWRVAEWKPMDVSDQYEPILKPTEAKAEQKGAITPPEEKVAKKRSKQDFDEFVKDVVSDMTNLTGVRIDGLDKGQVAQAVRNIKEGKETVASKRLMDALDLMYREGIVQFDASIRRGGTAKTVSLSDFRKSLQRSAEREREIEKEATDVVTEGQAKAVEQATGIKPKNLRDVFKAGREVFGLNRSQALAQAIIVDRVIGKIAKRRGVSKKKIYDSVEFKKSDISYFSNKGKKLYQLIGENARMDSAIKNNLSLAREMEASGATKETTRAATGWERGADGKWRYEIDDAKLTVKKTGKYKIRSAVEGDVLKAYPKLKKYTIEILPKRKDATITGGFSEKNNNIRIYANSIGEANKTLSHELQHAIQHIEGFETGTSSKVSGEDVYWKSMGEVEARNVQARSDMTSEQRKTTTIEETEDVARDEQVVLFQKGQGAKGAIQFLEDGNAIIHALTDPNVSTPLHEIAHLYEKYMTKSERDAVLRWAKTKEWNVDTSEKFARGFEKYLAEGVAPNEALKRVFDRFKAWLTDIYNGITGSEIDIELNDEMRSVYSAMLGEGVVRPKKTQKTKYKETFDDVDGLLFQDGTLYQGEDVTKRHTEAVNKLIDNYEKQGRKDVSKSVRDYLEERGNPVSEQIINNVLKERGYAKEQPSGKVQKESPKKSEGRRESDSDMPKGDRSKLQDGKKKEEVGYKSSRLGVRYAFGEGFTEEAKEAYRENQLHKYKPESQEEVVAVAEVVFNTNDDAAIERIVRGKETPRRVRQVLGVMLGNKYSQDAENALREGNTELGDQMIDAEQQIMKEVQRMATESGRDVAIFNSEFMTDMLTPYKTARMVERAMSSHADKVRKSHGYKKTKEIVQEELEKLRPSVMKAVGKDKRVQAAKKKAKRKSEQDPRKAKIRKEISDLTDMLRATKGSSASVSIIGLSNEQIEIGGKIAAKYLELGIVNVQELIQRLKKEFNKAGIEITDDEARQMIPERDGKTVEELEKEQALEAAAEKLAQEEFGYVADKRAPKTDPIAQMVRTLTSKFRERAKEGERPVPRSNMDVIKEAILNKTDYMEVWTEARQSAMDLIDKMVADEKVTEAQAEVYKQRVEDSYKRATTFSVSESRIQQLIRESFKEREISIDDVVRDHYERRELHKQELIDDLVAKSGLTNEAAKELADVIDNAFQTLMVQKGEALIKKYLKKKDVKPKKQGAKSPIAELIELINIGALNNPEFDAIFDEMYGVPQLTDRQRNEIIRRGKKIQKIKAADVRHKAEQDLMAYVMDLEGVNGAEVLTAFWYAHVLSGVPTHIRNISDAYVSSYLETLNLAGFDIRAIRGMIKAHRRGMKYEGRQRLIETMTTGFTPLAKKLEIPSALERIRFETDSQDYSVKAMHKIAETYRRMIRYIPRLLSATDSYIYAGAKEASAYIVKFRREVQRLEDEKGRKLNRSERKALHKHMNELLYVDKSTVERIRAEVEQESEDYKQIQRDFGEEPTGYNQREKYLREFELIDQQRGLDVTDTAFDIAGRAIGNIKSYGMLGAVVDGVSRFLRKISFTVGKPSVTMRKGKPVITFDQTKQVTIRPLALVIPFTRIVANVATRNLGWNMYWGAMRASTGAFGKFLGKDSQYYMEMSPEEKKVAWQKVLKIGIIHSVLFMLTQPDDDGDSFITITFDGTGNYEKNKQLEESGWKPYSIQIGDVSFSYLTLGGLAMLFAPIGYMRDKQKYTDTDNSDLELYAKGNLFAIGHVIKSTPVYAINKVFELINKMMTGDEEQFFKKLSQTVGSMATGFVSPKAVSDIINLMGVISQNPREKPETALARALQYVPLVDLDEGRIHYDVFGEAVPKNMSLSQIVEKVKRDDNVQYYIEQGYFRPSLSIHQTKFEIADDRDNRVRRPLNPKRKLEVELFNKYESTVGRRFKEEVMRLREDGVEGEEFVNEMESRWREIIKDAKADVYSDTRDRPLKYDKDAEIKE